MKKFFLFLVAVVMMAVSASAEVINVDARSFSYKYKMDSGKWTAWSDWERSTVSIEIDTDNLKVVIYSKEQQRFEITDVERKDDKKSETLVCQCTDADGKRCTVRLRITKDERCQLYVDYSDLVYVYTLDL